MNAYKHVGRDPERMKKISTSGGRSVQEEADMKIMAPGFEISKNSRDTQKRHTEVRGKDGREARRNEDGLMTVNEQQEQAEKTL